MHMGNNPIPIFSFTFTLYVIFIDKCMHFNLLQLKIDSFTYLTIKCTDTSMQNSSIMKCYILQCIFYTIKLLSTKFLSTI